MQRLFKLISVCFLISACLSFPASAAKLKNFRYLGLKHPTTYSPDGMALVMVVQDRYMNGSVFGLQLLVLDPRSQTQNFGIHALTPDYKEVVAIPDSNTIAFLQYDPVKGYGVHLFMPDTLEIKRGFAYETGDSIEQLQFSQDGQYYCYFMPFTSHPFESKSTKMKAQIARVLQPPGWLIKKMEVGTIKTKQKTLLFSKDEKEALTAWAPIEKPKVIPQLFTQMMPTITLDTQVQWSPDSKYIYVSDETGIWCVSLIFESPQWIPMWIKIVNAERVHRFQLSPIGTQLVYEVRPDMEAREEEDKREDPLGLENEIWLVDIEPILVKKKQPNPLNWQQDITAEVTPRKVAKGWGTTFNPNGKSIIYVNTEECNIISLETMKHHFIDWVTGRRLEF